MELHPHNPTERLEYYECPICLENGTTMVKLHCCKRQICRQCVCAWIAHKGTVADCPFCRDDQSIYSSVNCSDLIDYVITIKSVYPEQYNDHTLPQAIDNINQVLNRKYNIDNIIIQINYKDCPAEQEGAGRGNDSDRTHRRMCTSFVKLVKSYFLITTAAGLLLYTFVFVSKST
uniref:RING-type domain-containing protein n=1 Tax=viral metagenome TaxID=1070528 RepID=A0A6C0H7A6_9ZZZZ